MKKLNEEIRVLDGKKYYGDAWMEKRGDLYVLHLKGTPYDVGFQHGILMRDEIRNGVVKRYSDPINGGVKTRSLMSWILTQYLNYKIFKPYEKAQPRDVLDELKGIADGCGLPFKTIFKANHHTGVSMNMMPVIFKQNLKKFQKLGVQIGAGACSTFGATKEATKDGKTVVGRNTDYGGVEGWPKYQTAMFVEPEEGYKHVKLGTAGILLYAPGMNEKGIVLCGHYMIYEDITPKGWNIAAFTDEILRKASNLDEAIEILNNNPRGASCGFVIADGKTKDAFAAEVSSGKATIRRLEDNRLVMTNMAITEEKRKIDLVAKFNLNEGCPGRYRRLMQLIKKNYGKIDPSLAAEFMGDHIRYTTQTERTTYGIISVADNVNSIVFSPEDLKLWGAAGPAPVCNNPYIGFDFKEEIKGNQSKITPEILQGYQFEDPNKLIGQQKYIEAYYIFESNPKQVDNILELLREALKYDPDEIIYYQLIAKYLLRKGAFKEAISIVEKTLSLKQSLNEKAHNYLLLGIFHDLSDKGQDALSYYQKIADLIKQEPEDPWFKINRIIKAYAEKYRKKPFSKKQFNDRSVSIDFAQGAGIE